jgi:hypothetical protein
MGTSFVRFGTMLLVGCALGCREPVLTAGASGPRLAADQVLATDATIRFVDLEGGCWAIETPQGGYEPVSLAAQFQVDGMRIHAVIRGAPHTMSVCMIAPMVSVDSIRAR